MKYNQFLIKFVLIFFYFIPAKSTIDIKASTVILQDFLSGEILYEKDPDQQIYPASMTKIMTSIIAFDLIKKGDLSLDDKFLVSENAWRLSQRGFSSMFIMINARRIGKIRIEHSNFFSSSGHHYSKMFL